MAITQNVVRIFEFSGSLLPEELGAVRCAQHEELVDDCASADLGVVHVLDQHLPRGLAHHGIRPAHDHHV